MSSKEELNTDPQSNYISSDVVKKKIIKKKDVKFPTQRNDVLKRVFEIIGASQTKPYFKSHEIDSSTIIDEQINKLDDDIRSYFNISSWSVYKSNNVVTKRSISIIRSILRDMNVKYTTSIQKLINDPNCKFTTIYTIPNEYFSS